MKRILIILSLFLFSINVEAQFILSRSNYVPPAAVGGDPPAGASYMDDFEAYSNAALAGQGNWIAGIGTMNVTDVAGDNSVTAGSAAYSAVIYNNDFANDQYSAGTFLSDGGQYLAVGVRFTGTDGTLCGYALIRTPSATFLLQTITNGEGTTLATGEAPSIVAGDVMRLEVSGTTLSCYYNGALITSIDTDGRVTDGTYATGKAGMLGYGSGVDKSFGSWAGGDL